MPDRMIVILVHGWSVSHTNTYGELAARLKAEARRPRGVDLDVRNIWLSKYVSFRDEVRLEDLSRAFEAAIRRELRRELNAGRRFACITHSTGGPVVRDWWDRFYMASGKPCPMSHLVMLAPANFGSALAQLGKGRLSRIQSWFQGVEPRHGVLDWLELGSPESWDLNHRWVTYRGDLTKGPAPVFPFVLTGQTIDRKLYDHLNSYTGEIGSDGVVRVAAANLNATYIRLLQDARSSELVLDRTATARAWPTAFALIPGRSHSGEDKGILRSIRREGGPHPTVGAVLACLRIRTDADYARQRDAFARASDSVRRSELVERQRRFLTVREFIHDRRSMAIVRLRDDRDHAIADFDFLLTGKRNDPNLLPEGFFGDRQRNSRDGSTLTYFVNHTLMEGSPRIPPSGTGPIVRASRPGMESLGVQITARPEAGFVHYRPSVLRAQKRNLAEFLRPDQTTMVDIVLRRVIRRGVFELKNTDRIGPGGEDFTRQPPGAPIP